MSFSIDTIKKLNPVKQVNISDNTFTRGINHLSNLEVSKKYLWNIRFLPNLTHIVPIDFIESFPVIDFDLEEANLDTLSREIFMSTYKVPLRSKERTLKLTFFDNSYNAVFDWFKDWINVDILNNGDFISCINDNHARVGLWSNGLPVYGSVEPTRKIIIEKLGNDQSSISTQVLTIFPEGDIVFNGSSESGLNVYTMNFVIVDDGMSTTKQGVSENLIATGVSNITDSILNIDSTNLPINGFL